MRKTLLRGGGLVAAMALLPAVTAGLAASDVDSFRELDQFMAVLERVKADYVDKVDDKTLIKGAIDGMLASLDPHSSYLDARDFTNLRTQTDGAYGGLGLTVSTEDEETITRSAMSYVVMVARYWRTWAAVGCTGLISATSWAPGRAASAFTVSS